MRIFPCIIPEIVHIENKEEACYQAVQSVNRGDADIVMKGLVDTSLILRAVLDKDSGLRTGRILSHVAVFEVPRLDQFFLVTDAAINIAPSLQDKIQIVENAAEVARSLGIRIPKVVPVAAIEKVNPNMPATLDAAVLSKMADRGQIPGIEMDGPLGLDNAISLQAAKQKGIATKVAGRADILLVPDIESGNILYKSLTYFGGASVGGIVVGARAPVVLTSRADSHETKLHSIGLAVMAAYQTYQEMKSPVHS